MKRAHTMTRTELSAVVMSVITSMFAVMILIKLSIPEPVDKDVAIHGTPLANSTVVEHREVDKQEITPETVVTEPVSTWQDTITHEEVKMLAQTIYNEAQVLYWNGEKFGMSYTGRRAAVAWCALNRLDSGRFGDSLSDVLSAPNQFAWTPDAEVTDHMMWLAEDVLDRWWAEKQGASDVGRTLPDNYYFFCGYDNENWFRQEYESKTEWNWNTRDPYEDKA